MMDVPLSCSALLLGPAGGWRFGVGLQLTQEDSTDGDKQHCLPARCLQLEFAPISVRFYTVCTDLNKQVVGRD